jgi:hypothetical protein
MKTSSRKPVQGANYRFTALTPHLMRLEYSGTGKFVDGPTSVVVNREFPEFKFDYLQKGGRIEIITEALRLYYFPHMGPPGFSAQNLFIDMRSDLSAYSGRWRFGEQAETLKGTAHTLDMADGAVELGEGIISRNGYAVLDDTGSFVLVDEARKETQDGVLDGIGDEALDDARDIAQDKARDETQDKAWDEAQREARYEPREPASVDLYFFGYLHGYSQALTDFYHLTGPAPLLPRFALGNWWSRFWPYAGQEYLELIDRFEEHQVPLSVCMLDMDWHLRDIDPRFGSSWTGYTWNRELISDPVQFLQQLHQRGLKVGLNVHPADGVRAYEEAYPEVAKSLKLDTDLEEPAIFDLNEPGFVQAYFELVHRPLEKQGVDFWWVDWQQGDQGISPGLSPRWNLNYLHYRHSERSIEEPLILSRYAGPGSHRFPVGFSGDTIISWESLAFQPYFTASASNIGFGWWSHDIGGHMEGCHDPELMLRWMQFGVFSPINRMHSSSNPFNSKEPWVFGEPYQNLMVQALQLRHRLIPYLYTMNVNHHDFGMPLVLPMYYHDPDNESAYEVPGQYLFGSELMAAPLVTKLEAKTQLAHAEVWFPEGVWFDFFSGYRYEGETRLKVFRDLSEIPVFAKAGAIVPLDAEPFITPATNSRKSHRPFRQSALLAKSLHTTRLGCDSSSTRSCMRGFAASHIDGNPRCFVPAICCRGNNQRFHKTSELPEILNWKIFSGADNRFVLVEDVKGFRASTTVILDWEAGQVTLEIDDAHHILPAQRRHGFTYTDGERFYYFTLNTDRPVQQLEVLTSEAPVLQSVDLDREWFTRLQNFRTDYELKRRLFEIWDFEIWDVEAHARAINELRSLSHGAVFDALWEILYLRAVLGRGGYGQD